MGWIRIGLVAAVIVLMGVIAVLVVRSSRHRAKMDRLASRLATVERSVGIVTIESTTGRHAPVRPEKDDIYLD